MHTCTDQVSSSFLNAAPSLTCARQFRNVGQGINRRTVKEKVVYFYGGDRDGGSTDLKE